MILYCAIVCHYTGVRVSFRKAIYSPARFLVYSLFFTCINVMPFPLNTRAVNDNLSNFDRSPIDPLYE